MRKTPRGFSCWPMRPEGLKSTEGQINRWLSTASIQTNSNLTFSRPLTNTIHSSSACTNIWFQKRNTALDLKCCRFWSNESRPTFFQRFLWWDRKMIKRNELFEVIAVASTEDNNRKLEYQNDPTGRNRSSLIKEMDDIGARADETKWKRRHGILRFSDHASTNLRTYFCHACV